jgi:hypothetical protein
MPIVGGYIMSEQAGTRRYDEEYPTAMIEKNAGGKAK